MKALIEIHVRLNDADSNLHDILRRFARETEGWDFPETKSLDYQNHHGAAAGFVELLPTAESDHTLVAIASLEPKNPNRFKVTNIIPKTSSDTSTSQYNTVGALFAENFRAWLRTSSLRGSVKTIGPEKSLEEIVPGTKTRQFFESWLRSPTPVGHPSDLYLLDLFICHLFRYPGSVKVYEISQYLTEDQKWSRETANWVEARISTGLELLRVDRKY